MIQDISILYFYDTFRVLAPEMRMIDTSPYGEMWIKGKKIKGER